MAATFGLAAIPFLLVFAFRTQLYVKVTASSYLAIHNLIELFCVMVAFSIAGIAWFSFRQSGNRFTLFLGVAFLDIGLLDLVHTLSFPGMPAFLTASSTNKGILFWLSARALSALAFLVSAFIYPQTSSRWLSPKFLLGGALAVLAAAFVTATYLPDRLPTMFVVGRGLTTAKVFSEIAIVVLFALALLAYWRRLSRTGDRALLVYMDAFVVCIFSELAFVLYQSAYDSYNLLGHLYKLIAFALIYRGIFLMSVLYPYMQLVDANQRVREEAEERKSAERSLRAALEGMRGLISSANVMIIGLDSHGNIEIFNKAAEDITGYTMEELSGTNWFETIVPRERYPEVWGIFEGYQQKTGAMPTTFENAVLTKSGDERRISWQNSAVHVFPDAEISTISFGLDITEQARAQAALRESERRYRQLLASVTDYIYSVRLEDGQPRETVHGPGCESVTGYAPEEYAADPDLAARTVHPSDQATVNQQLSRVIAGRLVEPFEHRIRHRDGSVRWVRHTLVPRYDQARRLVAYDGLVSDISMRKHAEDEVVTANRELERRVTERTADLERANRELEAFSYSVSHDLRAPLRAIDGFSHILAKEYGDELDERAMRCLSVISRNTRRMDTLISDILDFSRTSRRELSTRPLDMAALTREVFQEVRSAAPGRKVTLVLDELPPARGDVTLVRQVLVNLLSNAVKFTGPRAEAVIEVKGTAGEEETVYQVSDNGVGFDMSEKDRLFGVFSRLHTAEDFDGTGIGLAIVERIITRHGGRVWADSVVDEGTSLYFTLPSLQPEPAVR